MSAVILDFIHANTAQSDMAIAEQRIRAQLTGFDESRICQAIARAERHIKRGGCVAIVVHQVVAWARYAGTDGPESA